MNSDFSKFLMKTIAAAIILAILGLLAFSFIFPEKYLPVLPWMLGFFALVTLITYYAQLRVAQKDFGRFTRSSMLVSFLRLILYSVFAFIYLSKNSDNAAVFVVCLAITYLTFTFIEVTDLSRVSKQNRNQNK
jgi:uncharacterized membrane protein HdeD (DUF308 family)